jgi:hypothetical protein
MSKKEEQYQKELQKFRKESSSIKEVKEKESKVYWRAN